MMVQKVRELDAKNLFCTLTSAVTLRQIIEILHINNPMRDTVGTNAYANFE